MSYPYTNPTYSPLPLPPPALPQQLFAGRANDKQRHNGWAHEQRDMFRRQKLERATQYLKAGLPARQVYDLQETVPEGRPMTTGTMFSQADSLYSTYTIPSRVAQPAVNGSSSPDGSPTGEAEVAVGHGVPVIPLPKPSFLKIYDRIQNEGKESINRKVRGGLKLASMLCHPLLVNTSHLYRCNNNNNNNNKTLKHGTAIRRTPGPIPQLSATHFPN